MHLEKLDAFHGFIPLPQELMHRVYLYKIYKEANMISVWSNIGSRYYILHSVMILSMLYRFITMCHGCVFIQISACTNLMYHVMRYVLAMLCDMYFFIKYNFLSKI